METENEKIESIINECLVRYNEGHHGLREILKHAISEAKVIYAKPMLAVTSDSAENKKESEVAFPLAVEFGYIQCEKGNNLETALINFKRVYGGNDRWFG